MARAQDDGQRLVVGERVMVGKFKVVGWVRFVGATEFESGQWVGIELELPDGKNDGSVNGKQYFQCKPKHGVFVRPQVVVKEVSKTEAELDQKLADGEAVTELLEIRHIKVTNGKYAGKSGKAWAVPDHSGNLQVLFALGPGDNIVILRPRDCQLLPQNEAEVDEPTSQDLVEDADVEFFGHSARVRYIGPLQSAQNALSEGLWVGLELQRPMGKNDGTLAGKRYFQCDARHGIFAQAPQGRSRASSSIGRLDDIIRVKSESSASPDAALIGLVEDRTQERDATQGRLEAAEAREAKLQREMEDLRKQLDEKASASSQTAQMPQPTATGPYLHEDLTVCLENW